MLSINTLGQASERQLILLKLKDNVGTGTNGYEEARNKLNKKLERENNPLRSSCLEQASNRDYMTKSGFQSDGSD